jgi:hypothetical protein
VNSARNETHVYFEPVVVAGRLHQLNVPGGVLREAVEYGVRYSADCTLHDPPSLAGIMAWGKITRRLRDRLVPVGWVPSNAQNYATTIHPKGAYAIVVAAGDAYTGLVGMTPCTRSEKGTATKEAVADNQTSFAEIDSTYAWPRAVPVPKQTWFLLHFMDEDAGSIRIELSLPAEMDDDGHVIRWRERVILRSVPIAPNPSLNEDSDDDGDDEIPVERRA